MEHFNGLTPAEAERLAILAEECGEVVQIIGKILRHGYESTHPNGGHSNRHLLECEIGDVFCAVGRMMGRDVSATAVHLACADKENRATHYLHHQSEG